MTTAELSIYIDVSPERAFDALADHEHFFRGKRIEYCKVVKPGSPDRNGLSAVRRVKNAGVVFDEEITHFERPVRFDYLITKCSLPIAHEGGQITFTRRGTGTEITWRSRFTIRVPWIGAAMAELFRLVLVDELMRMLQQAKHELEAAPR